MFLGLGVFRIGGLWIGGQIFREYFVLQNGLRVMGIVQLGLEYLIHLVILENVMVWGMRVKYVNLC